MNSGKERGVVAQFDFGDLEKLTAEISQTAAGLCASVGLQVEAERPQKNELVLIFSSEGSSKARCVFNCSNNPPLGRAITFESFDGENFKVLTFITNFTAWKNFLNYCVISTSKFDSESKTENAVTTAKKNTPTLPPRIGLDKPGVNFIDFLHGLKAEQRELFSILLFAWTGKKTINYRRLESKGLGVDDKFYDSDALYNELYSQLTEYRRKQLEKLKASLATK